MSVQYGGGYQVNGIYNRSSSRYRRRGTHPTAAAIDLTVIPAFPGIAAPATPTLTASTTGGTIPAETSAYAVTAYNANGETLPSTMATVANTGATSSNTVSWTAVTGAAGYRVYGRTGASAAVLGLLADVGNVLSYVDTGATLPGAIPPTINGSQVVSGAVAGMINAGDSVYRTASGMVAALYNPAANSATYIGESEDSYPERLGIDNTTRVGIPQYDTHRVPIAIRTSGEFAKMTTPGDVYTPGATVYCGLDPQTVTVVAIGTAIGKVCNDQNPVGGDYSSTITGAAGQEVMIEITPPTRP